jgi:tetratricopeptide (TPR) repeat protein
MRHLSVVAVLVLALSTAAGAADDRDPLTKARSLYNLGEYEAAIAAADQARQAPARRDSADLVSARALLERYRIEAEADDLAAARSRLSRVDPTSFGPRERIEYVVGLGETLYLENAFGAAAALFDSVLTSDAPLPAEEHERVLDWWASALDRDAASRTELERRGVYEQIRSRMREEIGTSPTSAAASYWLSMAARGEGDLQGAWDAAEAGWVRAPMASDRGALLRSDIDDLVLRALVPERSRSLGQPPETLRQEWERFKERWAKE